MSRLTHIIYNRADETNSETAHPALGAPVPLLSGHKHPTKPFAWLIDLPVCAAHHAAAALERWKKSEKITRSQQLPEELA